MTNGREISKQKTTLQTEQQMYNLRDQTEGAHLVIDLAKGLIQTGMETKLLCLWDKGENRCAARTHMVQELRSQSFSLLGVLINMAD